MEPVYAALLEHPPNRFASAALVWENYEMEWLRKTGVSQAQLTELPILTLRALYIDVLLWGPEVTDIHAWVVAFAKQVTVGETAGVECIRRLSKEKFGLRHLYSQAMVHRRDTHDNRVDRLNETYSYTAGHLSQFCGFYAKNPQEVDGVDFEDIFITLGGEDVFKTIGDDEYRLQQELSTELKASVHA